MESATKMTIYVGTQSAGCTFELEPRSRRLLADRRADDAPLPRSVYISCDTRQDYVAILGKEDLRWTIAEILTGLGREELAQRGTLEFLDPKRELAHFDPAAM